MQEIPQEIDPELRLDCLQYRFERLERDAEKVKQEIDQLKRKQDNGTTQ